MRECIEKIFTIEKTNDAARWLSKAISGKHIKWDDFTKAGVDEWYHDYYEAGEGLYIIHDRITDCIEFVEAKTPGEAYQAWLDVHHYCAGEEDDE